MCAFKDEADGLVLTELCVLLPSLQVERAGGLHGLKKW